MAEDGRSAAIDIARRRGGESFDTSLLSQSLPNPVKPKSIARAAPLDPPILELPQSSPAEGLAVDEEVGRTLIRYTADISAEEFSCSPAERQVYLSQSCPTWGAQLGMVRGGDPMDLGGGAEEEPAAPGAMAIKGGRKSSFEGAGDLIGAEGIIAASPTIFESFKMFPAAAAAEGAEEGPLKGIVEEEEPPREDSDEDAQFALED